MSMNRSTPIQSALRVDAKPGTFSTRFGVWANTVMQKIERRKAQLGLSHSTDGLRASERFRAGELCAGALTLERDDELAANAHEMLFQRVHHHLNEHL